MKINIQKVEGDNIVMEKFRQKVKSFFNTHSKYCLNEYIFLLLFILYACINRKELKFDNQEVKYSDDNEESLKFLGLANHYISYINADINELARLDRQIRGLFYANPFMPVYDLISYILLFHPKVMIEESRYHRQYSSVVPHYSIIYTIMSFLGRLKCESVYCPYSGINLYSLRNLYFDRSDTNIPKIFGIEPDPELKTISDIIGAILHLEYTDVLLADPAVLWPVGNFDSYITIMPFDLLKGDGYDGGYGQFQRRFFNKIIAERTNLKGGGAVVDFTFCRLNKYKDVRKALLETKGLKYVAELPDGCFGNFRESTFMLFFDFTSSYSTVKFITLEPSDIESFSFLWSENRFDILEEVDEERFIETDYSEIEKMDFSFLAAVFEKEGECEDGMEMIPLADLVSIDPDKIEYSTKRRINLENMSDDFKLALTPISIQEESSREIVSHIKGDSIVFTYASKIKIANVVDKGIYGIGYSSYALKVDESKISKEYLIYTLLNDHSFGEYIQRVTQGNKERANIKYILKRKIPIYRDFFKQKLVIDEILGRNKINVLWADNNPDSLVDRNISALFLKNNLNIVKIISNTVELKNYLDNPKVDTSVRRIDAIILNPTLRYRAGEGPSAESIFMVESWKLHNQNKWHPYLYTYSALHLDEIEEVYKSNRIILDYYNPDIHFNSENEDSIKLLAEMIQKDLGKDNTSGSFIRRIYNQELEAAEYIDNIYNEKDKILTDLVSRYLDALQTNNVNITLNIVRNAFHNIIEILKKEKLFPPALKNGAIGDFVINKAYSDRGINYEFVDDERMFPKELASSIVYVCGILNAGSHKTDGNDSPIDDRVVITSVSIVVYFIVWFRGILDNLSKIPVFWRIVEKIIEEKKDFTKKGILEKVIIGGRPYYYCGNVHLEKKNEMVEGSKIRILDATDEKQIKKGGIYYYSREWEYFEADKLLE